MICRDEFDYDASLDIAIYGCYTAAINDYIKRDLKYDDRMKY
jgi:hypothetical protein